TQAAKEAAGRGTILDGEFVVSDIDTGKPDFEATMARFSSNPKLGIERTPGLTFVAFDILQHKGQDLTSLDLMTRKEILEEAVTENEVIKKIRYMEHSFIPLFELCKQQQLEGIVIKRRDSRYYPGKRPDDLWQRVVVYQREQCFVLGYSKRKIAWLIGVERNGEIVPAGMMEYGITAAKRKEVFPVLLKTTIKETKDFAYVDPKIKVDVRFRNWTKQNKMRLAVLEQVYL
ncbi:ATP-dependent DNA ligase, partial [Brevibacillus reuszeri]|uniref:ATP-dependent DNA ligase n=1 Tax=Brevibacillus reuszeri TaxID=54915 RepID=UPI000CCBFC5A